MQIVTAIAFKKHAGKLLLKPTLLDNVPAKVQQETTYYTPTIFFGCGEID